MRKIIFFVWAVYLFFSCSSSSGLHVAKDASTPMQVDSESSSDDSQIAQNRLITYTVNITYESYPEKIEDHLKVLKQKSNTYKGYVSQSSLSSMTIKIPAKDYKSFYDDIILIDEVSSKSITSTDITDNYYNTQIRLQNAIKLKDRLQELLNKANNVKDAIEIERELSRVTEKIEIYEASMRRYGSQLKYTTFYIYFSEKSRPGPLGWVFYGLYKGVKWLFIWD